MKLWTKIQRRTAQVRWLLSTFRGPLRREWRPLTVATLFLVVEIGFSVLIPWPIKYIADGLLVPFAQGGQGAVPLFLVPAGYPQAHPWMFLSWVCGALVTFTVIARFAEFHRRVWSATAGQRMVMRLRKRLYDHLHRVPLAWHQKTPLGDLMLRVTGDIPMLRDALSDNLLELVGKGATVLVTIGVMYWIDPMLTGVSIGVMLLMVLLSATFTKKVLRAARSQRKKESLLALRTGETLRAVAQVKAYGREDEVTHAFSRENRSSLRAGLRGTRLQASLTRWVEILFAGGTASVLAVGVVRVLGPQTMTVGDLLWILSYVRGLNKPMRKMAQLSSKAGKSAACGERVLEVLQEPAEDVDRGRPLEHPRGAVAFRGTGFRYEDGTAALEGVDLEIAAGERVAIVGRNGAGKSTLLRLLLRLHEPTEGRVEVDGQDVAGLTLRSLRHHITVVLQESYLFGSTVVENLRFAAPDATDERIHETLRQLGADFLERLPGGLDAPLAEGGTNLSGGERRKLALAGGLLRRASILILDEPTANIDHRSRQDLVQRLPALTEGRTTLLVTHDPDMLTWVDRVVVLDRGRVLGSGPHDSLLRTLPDYALLFAESRHEFEGPVA